MTENQLRNRLRREVRDAGSKSAVARQYAISRQQFGAILNGREHVSERLAYAMGYRREYRFVPLEQ